MHPDMCTGASDYKAYWGNREIAVAPGSFTPEISVSVDSSAVGPKAEWVSCSAAQVINGLIMKACLMAVDFPLPEATRKLRGVTVACEGHEIKIDAVEGIEKLYSVNPRHAHLAKYSRKRRVRKKNRKKCLAQYSLEGKADMVARDGRVLKRGYSYDGQGIFTAGADH